MSRRQKRFAAGGDWTEVLVKGGSLSSAPSITHAHLLRRMSILSAVIIMAFLLLAIRLASIQIVDGASLKTLANGNRIREEVTYAPRGKILDRHGVVLADNELTFQLNALPYLLPEDNERVTLFKQVANILEVEPEEIEGLALSEGKEYVLPILLETRIEHSDALLLESILPEASGLSLDEVPDRVYTSEGALGHVIGYSGRVSLEDLELRADSGLLPTDSIGKAGVELSFDDTLRGQNGWVRYEVDALGRPVRTLESKLPQSGQDVYLSIDYEVQKTMASAIAEQMKNAKTTRGSGVAVDPVTGEVLAMVSLPAFDNNLFVGGISQSDFDKLNTNSDQPLFNKALTGGFTTGSIIKPLVASAALQEQVITESTVIVDTNALVLPGGFTFRSWRPGGLGPKDVRGALAWSSNIYFYTVGGGYGGIGGLGEEQLTNYYRQYGLGERSGIQLPNEAYGRVPDEEWKLANTGEGWYVGDSYNISIGQGDLLASPLQMTMAEAAIANNGYLLTPQLERNADRQVRREISVDDKYLQIVREGMREVLEAGTTCDCTFSNVPVTVAGKSGTAETNTPDGRPPHAWYTAFAPYDQSYSTQPEILATVLIEEGSGGSAFAAPAIADTFEAFYKSKAQQR